MSISAREVQRMDIRKVVDNEEWQALRSSFIGTWKTKQVENCYQLEAYLGSMTDPMKVRRVYNYLTGSGFRMGNIYHPMIDTLLSKVKDQWLLMLNEDRRKPAAKRINDY